MVGQQKSRSEMITGGSEGKKINKLDLCGSQAKNTLETLVGKAKQGKASLFV